MKTILLATVLVLAAGAAKAQISTLCVNSPGGLGNIPECSWDTLGVTTYPHDIYLKCHFETIDNFSCTRIPIADNSPAITKEMWDGEMAYHTKLYARLDFWERCAANLKCWRWLAPVR